MLRRIFRGIFSRGRKEKTFKLKQGDFAVSPRDLRLEIESPLEVDVTLPGGGRFSFRGRDISAGGVKFEVKPSVISDFKEGDRVSISIEHDELKGWGINLKSVPAVTLRVTEEVKDSIFTVVCRFDDRQSDYFQRRIQMKKLAFQK